MKIHVNIHQNTLEYNHTSKHTCIYKYSYNIHANIHVNTLVYNHVKMFVNMELNTLAYTYILVKILVNMHVTCIYTCEDFCKYAFKHSCIY